MKSPYLLFTLIILFIIGGCRKAEDVEENPTDPINPNPTTMEELTIGSNFDWKTTRKIRVQIKALDNRGYPLVKIPFSVLSDTYENGGKAFNSGSTDNSGNLILDFEIPTYYQQLVIHTNYIGLQNEAIVPVSGSIISYTFGGLVGKKMPKGGIIPKSTLSLAYSFLGTYNSLGVPDLIDGYDSFDQNFLSDVNAALPENSRVPVSHPEYIATNNETNLIIEQLADVWVTFVHEGAGYKNVLGFYTYDINSPPTSPEAIDTLKIMFPNYSASGSGGGLLSGTKVKIGRFPANTGIGWVLIANGWNGSTVTNGSYKLFSDPDLNTFISNTSKRQHIAFLHDQARGRFLIGFEDLRRDNGGSDEDFNDAVFYVTSNPVTAIKTMNVAPMNTTLVDSDGDGVSDIFDVAPSNINNAFVSYYPNEKSWASIAFEDLWPGKGDYDLNDAVVNFRIAQYSNGSNEVTSIKFFCYLSGAGASFSNGFAFQLPISPSLIQSVVGSKYTETYLSLNANGTESNQSKAVVFAFDNSHRMFSGSSGSNPPGLAGYNVYPNGLTAHSDTLEITVTMTNGVAPSDIGSMPYNPFLVTNKRRGYEVHLPNYAPTDLATTSLLGTSWDNSIPSQNRYYKTTTNLPWAILIPEKFEYPIEKVQIIQAYLKFATWAQSNGTAFPDWYLNNAGYRNGANIYNGGKRR